MHTAAADTGRLGLKLFPWVLLTVYSNNRGVCPILDAVTKMDTADAGRRFSRHIHRR